MFDYIIDVLVLFVFFVFGCIFVWFESFIVDVSQIRQRIRKVKQKASHCLRCRCIMYICIFGHAVCNNQHQHQQKIGTQCKRQHEPQDNS